MPCAHHRGPRPLSEPASPARRRSEQELQWEEVDPRGAGPTLQRSNSGLEVASADLLAHGEAQEVVVALGQVLELPEV